MAELCIIALIGVMIYHIWKYRFNHTVVEDPDKISPNAQICSVTSTKESRGKRKFIRTTVKFTDGVEFYTYKTRWDPEVTATYRAVDDSVRKQIICDAIKAHDKLISKQ